MTTSFPSGHTGGLGELVHAHRLYTGLSLRSFAELLGMREDSLLDIETGRRNAPPGFMDSVDRAVEEFDAQVDATAEQAEKMSKTLTDDEMVHFRVSDDPKQDLIRMVIGRAAVTSGLILPILTVNS